MAHLIGNSEVALGVEAEYGVDRGTARQLGRGDLARSPILYRVGALEREEAEEHRKEANAE